MHDHSQMLTAIVESTDDAIIAADTQLRIISWNRAAERMYGYIAQEVVGQPLSVIVPTERRHELEWLRTRLLRQDLDVERVETLRVRKDGTVLPVSLSYAAMRDASGAIIGFSTIGRDISGRKQAERQLLMAKAAAEASNLAKTQFLSNISHELRTPLNGILGLAQVLLDEASDTGRVYLDLIRKAGQDLLGIVNGMIDLAGVELGAVRLRHEVFSPRETLGKVLERFGGVAAAKGLAFSACMEASVPGVLIGDGARIVQVLSNLLSNAIRFTPAGSVGVRVRFTGREGVDGAALGQEDVIGNMLCIEVSDTGVGVPREKQEAIFDCFTLGEDFMTKTRGGVGMGLAVSRTLAEMMGGGVWLESEEGRGSVFSFCAAVSMPREVCSLALHPDVNQTGAAMAIGMETAGGRRRTRLGRRA